MKRTPPDARAARRSTRGSFRAGPFRDVECQAGTPRARRTRDHRVSRASSGSAAQSPASSRSCTTARAAPPARARTRRGRSRTALVEALRLGEVSGEPRKIAMSPPRNARPPVIAPKRVCSRNALNPCFVLTRTGERASAAAGGRAVGVDEVRVDERRALLVRTADVALEGIGLGSRRARGALDREPRGVSSRRSRRRRPVLVLVERRAGARVGSRAREPAAAPRAGAPPSRRCRRRWTWRTAARLSPPRRERRRPPTTRPCDPPRTRWRSVSPEPLGAPRRSSRAHRSSACRQLLGPLARGGAQLEPGEERVEDGLRDEHRRAAQQPPRTRPCPARRRHRVHERRSPGEAARAPPPRQRLRRARRGRSSPSSPTSCLELVPVPPLLLIHDTGRGRATSNLRHARDARAAR